MTYLQINMPRNDFIGLMTSIAYANGDFSQPLDCYRGLAAKTLASYCTKIAKRDIAGTQCHDSTTFHLFDLSHDQLTISLPFQVGVAQLITAVADKLFANYQQHERLEHLLRLACSASGAVMLEPSDISQSLIEGDSEYRFSIDLFAYIAVKIKDPLTGVWMACPPTPYCKMIA